MLGSSLPPSPGSFRSTATTLRPPWPSAAHAPEGYGRYGVGSNLYSLFPAVPSATEASAIYSQASSASRFGQTTTTYHSFIGSQKDSLFSTGYTFSGTVPSHYNSAPGTILGPGLEPGTLDRGISQLEIMAKGFSVIRDAEKKAEAKAPVKVEPPEKRPRGEGKEKPPCAQKERECLANGRQEDLWGGHHDAERRRGGKKRWEGGDHHHHHHPEVAVKVEGRSSCACRTTTVPTTTTTTTLVPSAVMSTSSSYYTSSQHQNGAYIPQAHHHQPSSERRGAPTQCTTSHKTSASMSAVRSPLPSNIHCDGGGDIYRVSVKEEDAKVLPRGGGSCHQRSGALDDGKLGGGCSRTVPLAQCSLKNKDDVFGHGGKGKEASKTCSAAETKFEPLLVTVKKEATPCQVSEVSTSVTPQSPGQFFSLQSHVASSPKISSPDGAVPLSVWVPPSSPYAATNPITALGQLPMLSMSPNSACSPTVAKLASPLAASTTSSSAVIQAACVKVEAPSFPPNACGQTVHASSPLSSKDVATGRPSKAKKEAALVYDGTQQHPVTTASNIPVGIAVARQRQAFDNQSTQPGGQGDKRDDFFRDQKTLLGRQKPASDGAVCNPPELNGCLATITGEAVLRPAQCDEASARVTNGIPPWAAQAPQGPALTPPTLWLGQGQYPAPVPVQLGPADPNHHPLPVGYQLVRDPMTGHLLLIPATNIDHLQRAAVVWPSYPTLPSHTASQHLQQLMLHQQQQQQQQHIQFLQHHHTETEYRLMLQQHQQTQHPAQQQAQQLTIIPEPMKKKDVLDADTNTIPTVDDTTPVPVDDGKVKYLTPSTTQTEVVNSIPLSSAPQSAYPYVFPASATAAPLQYFYEPPGVVHLAQTSQPSAAVQTDNGRRSQGTSPVNPAESLTPPLEVTSQSESEDGVHEGTDSNSGTEMPELKSSCSVRDSCEAEVQVQDASNQTETPPVSEDETVESCSTNSSEVLMSVVGDVVSGAIPEESCSSKVKCGMEIEVCCDDTNKQVEGCEKVMSEVKQDVVDLSGLELLSNSIEQFESHQEEMPHLERNIPTSNIGDDTSSCRELDLDTNTNSSQDCSEPPPEIERALPELGTETSETSAVAKVNDEEPCKQAEATSTSLGGLGLLCALAEQRFLEEIATAPDSPSDSIDLGSPLPCSSRAHDSIESDCSSKSSADGSSVKDVNRNYKSPKSEKEIKAFIASKVSQYQSGSGYKTPPGLNNPDLMDAMELDMRMRLAELQRKYREKQRELSKLQPKKDKDEVSPVKRGPGRPRKRKITLTGRAKLGRPPGNKNKDNQQKELSPPVLEKVTEIDKPFLANEDDIKDAPKLKASKDILKPPTLTANKILTSSKFKPTSCSVANARSFKLPQCNVNLVKLKSVGTRIKSDVDSPSKEVPSNVVSSTSSESTNAKKPVSEADVNDNDTKDERMEKSVLEGSSLLGADSLFWSVKPDKTEEDNGSSSPSVKDDEKQSSDSSPPESPDVSSSKKRKLAPETEHETSASDLELPTSSSYSLSSSSKKRKPGRPKKHSPTKEDATETIVAKKPKNISFILSQPFPSSPSHKPKIKPKLKAEAKIKSSLSCDEDEWPQRKVLGDPVFDYVERKNILASPTLPSAFSESSWNDENDATKLPKATTKATLEPAKSAVKRKTPMRGRLSSLKKKPPVSLREKRKSIEKPATSQELIKSLRQQNKKGCCGGSRTGSASGSNRHHHDADNHESSFSEGENVPLIALKERPNTPEPRSCIISQDELQDKLRALTVMGGLFYAGHINAIHAPDVYGITLDGERGNRPHIYSREEILKEAILEVKPVSTKFLPPGTRVCAYWSQQYRCLYPGTVASPSSPDPELDQNFVNVEFDDGDSGRIHIDDIRLLPPDFPTVEYDPNPLMSLAKRRRRASGASSESHSKDRKSSTENAGTSEVAGKKTTAKDKPKEGEATTAATKEDVGKQKGPESEVPASSTTAPAKASVLQPNETLQGTSIPSDEKDVKDKEVTDKKDREKKRLKRKEKYKRREKLKRLLAREGKLAKRKHKKHKARCEEHKHKHHHHHRKHRHKHNRDRHRSKEMLTSSLSVESPISTSGGESKLSGEESPSTTSVSSTMDAADHAEKPERTVKFKPQDEEIPPAMEEPEEEKDQEESSQNEEQSESDEVEEQSAEAEKDPSAGKADGKKSAKQKDSGKPKKRDRQPSLESRSKIAAFLPARQLWGWSGKGFKRPGAKGRGKKEFFKSIQRGKETITVGDCAVFLSTGRPDRPYIGRIEMMWESWGGNMVVKVKWFYHPEETKGGKCLSALKYPGALFQSPHIDENDVQTISHKCEVLAFEEYKKKIGEEPSRYNSIYDNNDIYYLAGSYDPTNGVLTMEPGVCS